MENIKKPAIEVQAENYIQKLEAISREEKSARKAVSELREAQLPPQSHPSQQK